MDMLRDIVKYPLKEAEYSLNIFYPTKYFAVLN
jgi:hypothetical protein